MAEDTEIYSGEKIRRLPTGARRWKNNINESYAKFYKAGSDSLLEASHGELIFLARCERPLLEENSRRQKRHKLSKLY